MAKQKMAKQKTSAELKRLRAQLANMGQQLEQIRQAATSPPPSSPYRPRKWQKPADIWLREFREILLWPLAARLPETLQTKPDGTPMLMADYVHDRATDLDNNSPHWQRICDLLDHLGKGEEKDVYAEFVYFYNFVQNFLYSEQGCKRAARQPLYLFCRKDIKAVRVTLKSGQSEETVYELKIDRLNLYLFETGVAMLALELATKDQYPEVTVNQLHEGKPTGISETRPFTLANAQQFLHTFRSVYPPFYENETTPGFCPKKIEWLDHNGLLISGADFEPEDLGRVMGQIRKAPRRVSPVANHLLHVMQGLQMETNSNDLPVDTEVWRQVVDERIPTMACLSLTHSTFITRWMKENKTENPQNPEKDQSHDREKMLVDLKKFASGLGWEQIGTSSQEDLWQIRRGDWIRLGGVDQPGHSDLPYNTGFLQDFEKEHCYDRFFPCDHSTDSTRQMFAGYAYTVVGSGGFFDSHIQQHFRRQYFQMALLAHFESASLLSFSSQISEAVARFNDDKKMSGAAFQQHIISLQQEFIRFVNRFRFTGVSHQLQAGEMYEIWRRQLRLQPLYEDIRDELGNVTSLLFNIEQDTQTRVGNNLNIIASVGLVVGLAFAFMGANLLFENSFIKGLGLLGDEGSPAWNSGTASSFFAILAAFLLVGKKILDYQKNLLQDNPLYIAVNKWLHVGGGLCVLCAVILFLFALNSSSKITNHKTKERAKTPIFHQARMDRVGHQPVPACRI